MNTINDYRLLTAPVLMPGIPDCDYNNGETPLTPEQIKTLMESYKEHQIIDYNHKYMFQGPWYKRNLGEPTNIWISEKSTDYVDRFGVERTAPPGTWWQTTKVTDPEAIQLVDDEKLNAYSLTTVNKEFLEKFLQLHKVSNKNNEEGFTGPFDEHVISTKYRTPIARIKNPVGFTVSLVDFPCVGGAVFARDCLLRSQPGNINNKRDDTMADETKNNGGWSMNDVKELFGLFTSIKADNEEKQEEKEEPKPEPETEEFVTKEELDAALEDNNKKLINEIKDIIDEKIGKEDETGDEAKEGEEETGDEAEGKVSNKNNETGDKTMEEEPAPQSQQLDDPIPEEETSYKKGTPEYRILQKLGRDALGNSKIRL